MNFYQIHLGHTSVVDERFHSDALAFKQNLQFFIYKQLNALCLHVFITHSLAAQHVLLLNAIYETLNNDSYQFRI